MSYYLVCGKMRPIREKALRGGFFMMTDREQIDMSNKMNELKPGRYNSKYLHNIAKIAVFVAIAIFCRIVRYSYDSNLLDAFLNFIRISIYIGIFTIWGVSVSNRVIQHQVRRLLIAVSLFMVLWLTVREFKFHFILDPVLLRYMWYSYYIPMLGIPLLAVYISMSLGKPEQFRIPGRAWFLCIPTLFLIGVVLTNEFHQMVFDFPDKDVVWTEFNCSYGIGFFAAVSWEFFCSVLSLIIMICKSGKPQNRKTAWLPMIPFIFAFVYAMLYILRVRFVVDVLGDTAVVYCLSIAGVFECCIWCGLIQSNSMYSDLFIASVDLPVWIVDEDYNVRYKASSDGLQCIRKDDMMLALTEPVVLEGGRRLHNMRINGGYVIWAEDISELLTLREKLEDNRRELIERNDFLQYEYEREREYKTIEEQNRLYDLLQNRTQKQLDRIDELVRRYEQLNKMTAVPDAEKQKILKYIVILGTFVKRRKDFVLSANDNPELSKEMLGRALSESFRALKLLDIKGGFLLDVCKEHLPSDILILMYDFFEDVVEHTIDKLNYINVRVSEMGENIRINILTDCLSCQVSMEEKYEGIRIVEDEEGTEFLLSIKGGVMR